MSVHTHVPLVSLSAYSETRRVNEAQTRVAAVPRAWGSCPAVGDRSPELQRLMSHPGAVPNPPSFLSSTPAPCSHLCC